MYLDKDIVNTTVRKDFILQDMSTLIKKFEKDTGLDVHISGMLHELMSFHVTGYQLLRRRFREEVHFFSLKKFKIKF